jgi:hypothetical protein
MVLLLALMSVQAGLAQSRRYTVAVLPFTVTDSSGRTPQALGETLPNYFEAPIFDSQKFVLIDSSITARLVEAAAQSDQGLTREKIKELGSAYDVDILISGSITAEQQSPQPYLINARFIDTSIGEVRSVTQVRISSDADFQAAAQQIVSQAVSRFPLEGQIYATNGGDIYIDIGIIHGLSPFDEGGLVYRQVTVKDKTIREHVGSFSIRQMYQDSSKITVDMLIGYDAKEGDRVTIEAVRSSAGLTSSQTEDVASTPNETTIEAAVTPATEPIGTTGNLDITSNASAEVYLDGEYMGVTPLSLEVEAGDYTLELWAEGYQKSEQTITVSAAQQLTVEQTLQEETPTATESTVTLNLTPAGTVVRIDGKLQLNRSFSLPEGDYTLELRHNGYETKVLPLSIKDGEDQTITETLLSTTEAQETASSNTAMATLELSISPAEAVVTIDGVISQAGILSLSPGMHTISVSLDGYDAFETQLEMQPGQSYPLEVLLTASQVDNTKAANTSETATTGATIEATTQTTDTSTTDVATSGADMAQLPLLGCEGATSLKSGEFVGESQILFMNQGQNPVKTYWVNYEGQREFYNVLLPGQEVLQQTALGHVWIVTDVNDECIAVFEPVAEPTRAILE